LAKKLRFPRKLRGLTAHEPATGKPTLFTSQHCKTPGILLPCANSFGRQYHLATRNELAEFLKSAERRAFKQAYFAVHDQDLALDIVQDAMLKLAEKYAAKPVEELPLLFTRILQNGIRDHYRRQKVRNLWTTLLSSFSFGKNEDEEHDPLETLEAADGSNLANHPPDQLNRLQTIEIIEKEIEKLPARQREAFLLRYWEEMDVAETAEAMGCSEGSVKTHCSRATHTLAEALKAKGITL
jgi:RNA polymerase sigma-70 factor (ECF subfamily)